MSKRQLWPAKLKTAERSSLPRKQPQGPPQQALVEGVDLAVGISH